MSTVESGSFEQGDEASYLSPSPKRARFEDPAADIAEVTEVETIEAGGPDDVDHTVTITVPSTQFEIEINSQAEGSPSDEIGQIQTGDLAGPAFGIVQDAQDLQLGGSDTLNIGTGEDGSTLNAIGRALVQMQQGGQTVHGGQPVPQSQIILTRTTSNESESGQNSGTPLYVMIPPASSAEILQAMGQSRPIAPKAATTSISKDIYATGADLAGSDITRKSREAQRKATHNEVERRRRDRINELIKVLAQIVPGCQKKDTATGNVVGYVYSKGTVLDKTVEYLKELITQNDQLAGTAKLAEKSANALSLLQNQITVLEKENAFLRAQIIQFGIDAAASNSQTGTNRQLLNSPLAQSLLNTVAQSASTPPAPAAATVPPAQTATQNAAQQLLLSLAQSLTNSPLLTSLTTQPPSTNSQLTTPPQTAGSSPPMLTSSPLASQVTPTRLTSSHQMTNPPPSVTPQLAQSALGLPSGAQNTPILNSLVQTLASITNTTTSPSTPNSKVTLTTPSSSAATPQPQAPSGGLSAAAAASLLNTLIMAQNVLTGGGSGSANGGGPAGTGGLTDSTSVLNTVGLETVATGGQTTPQ